MKAVICLVALIAVANAAKTLCPMTVCDSSLGDNCYSVTNTSDTFEIKIKNCGTSKYCNASNFVNPTTGTTATCVAIPDTDTDSGTTVKDMYPGYSCTKDSECASDKCGSNGCTGLAENADCVTFAKTTVDAVKMCGAGLYCSDNKCITGAAATKQCTTDRNCSGRNVCIGEKCIAPASIAKDATCTGGGNLYCESGLYCSGTTCAEDSAYTPGSYGATCSADTGCDSKASCNCAIVNPDGMGNCGTRVTTEGSIYGTAALNSYRTSFSGSAFNCPLGWPKSTNGGCAGEYTIPSYASQKTESCYKNFVYAGGLLPQPSSSAFGLYASVLGFVAYLLA